MSSCLGVSRETWPTASLSKEALLCASKRLDTFQIELTLLVLSRQTYTLHYYRAHLGCLELSGLFAIPPFGQLHSPCAFPELDGKTGSIVSTILGIRNVKFGPVPQGRGGPIWNLVYLTSFVARRQLIKSAITDQRYSRGVLRPEIWRKISVERYATTHPLENPHSLDGQGHVKAYFYTSS